MNDAEASICLSLGWNFLRDVEESLRSSICLLLRQSIANECMYFIKPVRVTTVSPASDYSLNVGVSEILDLLSP